MTGEGAGPTPEKQGLYQARESLIEMGLSLSLNGRPSDAHTVDLLRQAAIERNERHAAAFEAGVEQGQVLSAMREHLDSLDCPMDVQVREGYCDAYP